MLALWVDGPTAGHLQSRIPGVSIPSLTSPGSNSLNLPFGVPALDRMA